MPMIDIRSVVDFGCGDGVWLRTFQDRGVARILGYDADWTDTRELQFDWACFRVADLTAEVSPPGSFDLAICLEVGEHLPASASNTLLASICAHAPVILFGAAIPMQGGYRHINERWQSAWAAAFRQRGYSRFDFIRAQIWDDPDVHFWYKQNIAVYVREDRPDVSERLREAIDAKDYPPLPLDIVHPDLFVAISTYDQIAFRPLLRRLARRALSKMRDMTADRVRATLGSLRRPAPARR